MQDGVGANAQQARLPAARWLTPVVLGGASAACAYAAVGVALYAQGPSLVAAWLFAAVGMVAGLICAGLQIVFGDVPAAQQPRLSSEALTVLVRSTLANAAANRPARSGSAADRQPALVAPPAAPDLVTVRVSLPAVRPAPVVAKPAVPAASTWATQAADARQFASSAFEA